jgi:putative membrane protein
MATPADSTGGGSPVPGSTAQMTDPEIVTLTQAADEGEIATSKVALTKATNPDVRRYAQEMIAAHTKMISQRSGQLKATGMAPAAGAKDSSAAKAKEMVAMLEKAPKGAAFDTAYINGQAMAHAATLTMVQKAQGVAKDPALKTMLTNAAPVVQKHLEDARALQGKLAGGAAPAASGAQ